MQTNLFVDRGFQTRRPPCEEYHRIPCIATEGPTGTVDIPYIRPTYGEIDKFSKRSIYREVLSEEHKIVKKKLQGKVQNKVKIL